MQNRLIQWFKPPEYTDETENRLAGLLHWVSGFVLLITIPGIIVAPIVDPGVADTVILVGLMFVLSLATHILNRVGYVRNASVLLAAGLWSITTYAVVTQGGMGTPFTFLYFIVLLICSLLLGAVASITAGFFSIITLLLILILQNEGLIYTSKLVQLDQIWATFTLVIILSGMLLGLNTNSVNRLLQRMRTAQTELENSNRELATVQFNLEERIAARTADLERRTRYLEASTEIGRVAASSLDAEELIRRAVDQICERFNLYYTGLFLIDEEKEWAILRAGTGPAGEAMLKRGHRIKIGAGMIGWCILNAQPRVTHAAHEDLIRLITPELPDTRSEAALPLRSRGQVLGAISVQSREPDAFDNTAVGVLQALADQVAVAIDNSRLFAESQEALHLAHQAYGETTGRAWDELISERPQWGYIYSHDTINPAARPWRPAMIEAVRTGQPVLATNGGVRAAAPEELAGFAETTRHPVSPAIGQPTQAGAELVLPLQIRGRSIGVFSFRKPAGQSWAPAEVELLQTLLEQLAQAVESARLYHETQRRALRERLAGEVVSQMRASLDVEAVLQTAIREIAERLSIPQVEVHLGSGPTG